MKKLLVLIALLVLPYNAWGAGADGFDSTSAYPAALDARTDTCNDALSEGAGQGLGESCWDVTDATGGAGDTIWADQFEVHSDAIIKLESKVGASAAASADDTPSDDQTLIGTDTNKTRWTSIGDCDDSSGQHLNYDTTNNAFSCGTSHPMVGGTNGIDISTNTINFDATEVDGNITWGAAAGATIAWTWDVTTGDPSLTFGNGLILIPTTQQLQFRDSAIYLASLNDGYLDIEADTAIRMLGPVDMGANALDCDSNTVTLSTVAGAIDAGGATSLEIPNDTDLTTTGPIVTGIGQIGIDTDDDQFWAKVSDTVTLRLDGTSCSNGQVLEMNASGVFVCATDDTAGAPTLNSVGSPTGASSWTMESGETVTFTSAVDGAANWVTIQNSSATQGGQSWLLNLDHSAANEADTNADFLVCQDVDTEVFKIESDGNTSINGTLNVGGTATITGDLTVTGDDIYMNTNTSGAVLVADGTNFNPVVMSGDATIGTTGTVAIAANAVTLATDTTGNYVATIADAGNTTVTVANSGSENSAVTLDVVDLHCTDCINATEIEDIYLLDGESDTMTGTLTVDGLTLGDDENITLGSSNDWTINFDDSVDDQLLFLTAATTAGAITDPLFEIIVGATPTANQQVFGVSKGTQSSNTALFTLDEDGDANIQGNLSVTGETTLSSLLMANLGIGVSAGAGAAGLVALYEAGSYGSNYITLQAPASMDNNIVWTLPATVTNGYVLSTDGSGTLSWVAPSAGTGDVTDVGDCISGACLDGSTDGGTQIAFYDGDSNKVTLDTANLSGDRTIVLPDNSGTILTTGLTAGDYKDDSINDADINWGTNVTLTDVVNADGDHINTDTDDTFDFTRDDSGTVTLTASDNDANAALVVAAGGTGALTLGASGNGSITFISDGTGNAEFTFPNDVIGDADIDWGSSTGQIDVTDVEGATSVNILLETEIDGSSELAAIMDDETGTGALVFANTPTLVTPNIGAATGTSLTLSNSTTPSITLTDSDDAAGTGSLTFASANTQDIVGSIYVDVAGTPTEYMQIDGVSETVDVLKSLVLSAGVNIGTSQAIVGTTAMTIGNNNQTVAVNSSDWDIDATGVATGLGNITSDGTVTVGVGIDAIGAVDIDYGSADVTDHTFVSDGGTVVIDGSITTAASASPSFVLTDTTCTDYVADPTHFYLTITGVGDAGAEYVDFLMQAKINGTPRDIIGFDADTNPVVTIGSAAVPVDLVTAGTGYLSVGGTATVTGAFTASSTAALNDNVTVADGKSITFDEAAANPDDADVKLSAADGKLTIASVNGANNEDISIDTDVTANEVVVSSSTGASLRNSLPTMGKVKTVNAGSGTTYTLTTNDCMGQYYFGYWSGTTEYVLPSISASDDGLFCCFYAVAALQINASGDDQILYHGTGIGAAECLTADATGEFICLVTTTSGNQWVGINDYGTWADGGATCD